ncbi:tripartite tricarboxylate transporter TctB family protein [Nocardioides sp. NPDC087217]|uniref:tripartite tricarboxylate transporter TctB family protein n=1 Tax=Nocardioides sp. NPDC087217 TaxID=3364335 RepID=UPI0038186735
MNRTIGALVGMMRRDRLRASSRYAEPAVAALLLAWSVWMLLMSFQLGWSDDSGPGAGLFPGLITVMLAVLAALWAVQSMRPPRSGRDDPGPVTEAGVDDRSSAAAASSEAEAGSRRTILLVLLWSLIPILLLNVLGFTLTVLIYVGGMLIGIGKCRPQVALPLTLGGAIAFAVLADLVGIYLPDRIDYVTLMGM